MGIVVTGEQMDLFNDGAGEAVPEGVPIDRNDTDGGRIVFDAGAALFPEKK